MQQEQQLQFEIQKGRCTSVIEWGGVGGHVCWTDLQGTAIMLLAIKLSHPKTTHRAVVRPNLLGNKSCQSNLLKSNGFAVQEIEEIFKIFQHLGTPNERVWPGIMRDCPDFKTDFPQWHPKPFRSVSLSSRVPRGGIWARPCDLPFSEICGCEDTVRTAWLQSHLDERWILYQKSCDCQFPLRGSPLSRETVCVWGGGGVNFGT